MLSGGENLRTFKGLLDRLNEVQGVPFKELAEAHEIDWHEEPERNKWVTGRIVEAALGLAADSAPRPDLTDLAVEIKSIPIGGDGGLRPHEHTKVTMLDFQDVLEEPWERSRAHHKLRNILFAPVVKHDKDRPDHWYIRSPFIWMPSLDALEQLKQDYLAVQELLEEGAVGEISGARPPKGQGRYLLANTAGRDASDTTNYVLQGESIETKRRAWMLRKDFTERILEENIRYRPRPRFSGSEGQTSIPSYTESD